MKKKPLLILIPCIMILWGFFLFESFILNSDASVKPSEKTDDKTDQPSDITIDLVIGKAGSIREDVGNTVYSAPDDRSDKLGTLQYNCCMLADEEEKQTDRENGWIAVIAGDDKEPLAGFVKEEDDKGGLLARQKAVTVSDISPVRMKIVKTALSYLGLKFSRYGDSLTKGIDCSNFIQQVYKLNGINIPSSCNDIISRGEQISENKIKPGDIIYYPVNNGYGHVAIYLADGFVINSTGHAGKKYPDGGVRICCLKYRDREEYSVYNVIDNI